jgi:S-DNA-T family DNA segregation ATPase FtsK/SpoIIIE
MRLGYARAARIVDAMELEGIVGPADGSKPREILVGADFIERLDEMKREASGQ